MDFYLLACFGVWKELPMHQGKVMRSSFDRLAHEKELRFALSAWR